MNRVVMEDIHPAMSTTTSRVKSPQRQLGWLPGGLVCVIGWSAVVFGINSRVMQAGRSKITEAKPSATECYFAFLPALLVLLIPNTTADHPITD